MTTRWDRENRLVQRWVNYESREVTRWLLTLQPSRRAAELRRIMEEWRRSGVALNPADVARVDASLDRPAAREVAKVVPPQPVTPTLPEPPAARITTGQRLAGAGWVILAVVLGGVALLVAGWLGLLLVQAAAAWAEANPRTLSRGLSVVALLAALGWFVRVFSDEHRPCRVEPIAGLAAACFGSMLWFAHGLPVGVFLAFVVLGVACAINVYVPTFAAALALAWVRQAWG